MPTSAKIIKCTCGKLGSENDMNTTERRYYTQAAEDVLRSADHALSLREVRDALADRFGWEISTYAPHDIVTQLRTILPEIGTSELAEGSGRMRVRRWRVRATR